ncbi:redox-regulated ATPase YchF [bacterium]|nr:redox-regulated ATPase YchF [bacterium]
MKLGLIGVRSCGKTTIFNALTNGPTPQNSQAKARHVLNRIFIPVSDSRIDQLARVYQPKKTTYASIELVDFPDFLEKGPGMGENVAEIVLQMKTTDGLAVVLRNFDNELGEPIHPLKDLEKIEAELQLNDLIMVENRLARIEWSRQRGKMTSEIEREENILRILAEHLGNSHPIREIKLSVEEQKLLRGFQFLSQKPLMIILNSDETRFNKSGHFFEQLNLKGNSVEFSGKFEMELVALTDIEEARLFMADLGIEMSARERLTQIAYKTLGLISFFTVGPDEVRAWTIHQGDTAIEAARVIHSDLARGFIRAACFAYSDLTNLGSEKKIREKGLLRLEGKDYIVPDGTVMEIKFNV